MKENQDYILRTGPYYFMNFQRFECKGLASHVMAALLTEEELLLGEKTAYNFLAQQRLRAFINPQVGKPLSRRDDRGFVQYYLEMRSAIADACPGLVSKTPDGEWIVELDSYLLRVPRNDLPHAKLFADLVEQTLDGYDRMRRQAERYLAGDPSSNNYLFFPDTDIPEAAPCKEIVDDFIKQKESRNPYSKHYFYLNRPLEDLETHDPESVMPPAYALLLFLIRQQAPSPFGFDLYRFGYWLDLKSFRVPKHMWTYWSQSESSWSVVDLSNSKRRKLGK